MSRWPSAASCDHWRLSRIHQAVGISAFTNSRVPILLLFRFKICDWPLFLFSKVWSRPEESQGIVCISPIILICDLLQFLFVFRSQQPFLLTEFCRPWWSGASCGLRVTSSSEKPVCLYFVFKFPFFLVPIDWEKTKTKEHICESICFCRAGTSRFGPVVEIHR